MSTKDESQRDHSPTDVGLEYFCVEGLHQRQDVSLIMSGRVGIFIADNGSGKTTALYMLQCILKSQFSKLNKFSFKRILIKFNNSESFCIEQNDYEQNKNASMWARLMKSHNISNAELYRIGNLARNSSMQRMREDSTFNTILRQVRMPASIFVERLKNLDIAESFDPYIFAENSPIVKLKNFLDKNFCHSILYLPTYRRVEQDAEELFNLGDDEGELSFKDIHFGMRDVDDRINNATRQIRDHFIASYGQISGQTLGQLADNTPISDEMRERLIDRNNIELVLARVGENVSDTQKSLILKLYDDESLLDNRHLSFFLSSLIEAYEQVKQVDASLQRYAKVCNRYLINKELRYDGLNATVSVYETIGGTKLDLDTLSSGEKQILGVMSELYLGENESYVVIFDEPELSLSMDWQKKILVDVAASEKTHSLIAVTHSPFVFENELDQYARSLKVKYHAPMTEN